MHYRCLIIVLTIKITVLSKIFVSNGNFLHYSGAVKGQRQHVIRTHCLISHTEKHKLFTAIQFSMTSAAPLWDCLTLLKLQIVNMV